MQMLNTSGSHIEPQDASVRTVAIHREANCRAFGATVALVSIVAGTLLLIASPIWPTVTLLSIALLIFAMAMVPVFIRPDYRLAEPWSFVLLSILVGVVLRSAVISFGMAPAGEIDRLFILGRSTGFFVYPGLLLALGVLCSGLAYSIPIRHSGRFSQRLKRQELRVPRLYILAALFGVISVVAAAAYISATGGPGGVLSAKRTTITSALQASEDERFRSYGYLRELGNLGVVACLIVALRFSKSGGIRWRPLRLFVLLLLLSTGIAIPFYSSTKADFLWPLLSLAVVLHLAAQGVRVGARPSARSRVWSVIAVGVVVLGLLSVLSGARGAVGFGRRDVLAALGQQALIDSVVLNRNFVDIPKTAQIINRVPSQFDFANGSTIIRYMIAPIPRELWPRKPLVAIGPELGNQIYGTAKGGVPPGAVAELYWNFGFPGVLAGSAALGVLLRWSRRWFLWASSLPGPLVVYAFALAPLGPNLFGTSIGSAIVAASLHSIEALLVVAAMSTRVSLSARARALPLRR